MKWFTKLNQFQEPSNMLNATNTTMAWGAVTSPVWLPSLKSVSEFAGLVLPILGALWISTQIFVKIYVIFFRSNRNDR